jgi:epoxyqueuosine reductase
MKLEMGAQIIDKARRMGATMAGIASVDLLKKSPSNEILSIFGTKVDGVHSSERAKDFKEIKWPINAKSALVLAISHPQDKMESTTSYSTSRSARNRSVQRSQPSVPA